jgi:hypothetical protein
MAPVANEPPWLSLLVAFDVIFVGVATLVFRSIVEE